MGATAKFHMIKKLYLLLWKWKVNKVKNRLLSGTRQPALGGGFYRVYINFVCVYIYISRQICITYGNGSGAPLVPATRTNNLEGLSLEL